MGTVLEFKPRLQEPRKLIEEAIDVNVAIGVATFAVGMMMLAAYMAFWRPH